jgi:hypothetical protein
MAAAQLWGRLRYLWPHKDVPLIFQKMLPVGVVECLFGSFGSIVYTPGAVRCLRCRPFGFEAMGVSSSS